MSRLVRTSAFTRNELIATLRQPRLLVTLVLGPFLVLFVFGLGYEHELPELATVVVSAEGELVEEVDRYLREVDPAGLDYRGTTDDRERALADLRGERVDLVVILPEHPMEVLEQDERAVIEIHQRSLDPVTDHQVYVAANLAVDEINDLLLEDLVGTAQERSEEYAEQLTAAREQLDQVRAAVSREDLRLAQRAGRETADRFERLADLVAGGGTFAGFGLGDRAAEYEDSLRSGAELLRTLSRADADAQLDEAATTLAEIDEVVAQLRAADPEVIVRPFRPEVISATPVAVTLDRFFAPGLVALMLQHLAVTFGALSLVRERSQGTVETLRVSPASLGERLAGRGIGFLVLGGLMAAGLTALIMLAFGVPAPHSWLVFVAVVALVLLASLGYGYLVAAVSSSNSQAVQLSMLLFLTAIFFSGLFMPLERISFPVEIVSWLMPATYGFLAMQQLMLLDRVADPALLGGLVLLAVVLLALARWSLGRRERIG